MMMLRNIGGLNMVAPRDAVELPFELLISLCREFQLGAQEMLRALWFDVLPRQRLKNHEDSPLI